MGLAKADPHGVLHVVPGLLRRRRDLDLALLALGVLQ